MNANKSILITGGLGYIGSHTVLVLLENNYNVEIIDNLYNSKAECLARLEKISTINIKFHNVDLLDYSALESIFNSTQFTAIIHFAGLKAVGESVAKPLFYYRNNLVSTMNLLELCQKYDCNNFIFSSSACVYGESKEGILTEESPLSPINPYGKSKLMQENILKDVTFANKNFKVISLRYFNPAGAHPSGLIGDNPKGIPNNLFPILEQVILGKRPKLSVYGKDWETPDGTPIRDYIHVMDLAYGHVASLNKIFELETGFHTYNLGIGKGHSVLEVISAYSKVIGRDIPYEFVDRRPGDAEKCVSNPSKAERELNWKAEQTISDMCRDSYNWIQNNPNGYEN